MSREKIVISIEDISGGLYNYLIACPAPHLHRIDIYIKETGEKFNVPDFACNFGKELAGPLVQKYRSYVPPRRIDADVADEVIRAVML